MATKKIFTWRQNKPIIQRRLDYWLTSDRSQEDVETVDILRAIRADHSAKIFCFE